MKRSKNQQDIQGNIDGLYGDLLHGWVIDMACPDLRVAVELYLDESFIAVGRADKPQAGAATSAGDGLHGFSFKIPLAWLSQASCIGVRVANQGPWLTGRIDLQQWADPASSSYSAATPIDKPISTPNSHVSHDGGLLIQGWAVDSQATDRYVKILVREDRVVHAQACANLPHPALLHGSSADHGFKLNLPWALADGELHELQVENDLGEALLGSPLTVCMQPEGLAASLYKLWPSSDKRSQESVFNLLMRLAQEQDKRAPHSLPFNAYPHWFELQQQELLPQRNKSAATVGALVLDEGEVAAEMAATTIKSLRLQKLKTQHIRQVPAGQALKGLRDLLQKGVTSVIVISSGDHLAPQAMPWLLDALQQEQECGTPVWVYSDCDQDDEQGRRHNPWFKPAWDFDYFLGSDVFTMGALYSAAILNQAVDYLANEGPDNATAYSGHWHTLACAIVAVTLQTKATVAHLPKVIYHRAAGKVAVPFELPTDPSRSGALQWLTNTMDTRAQVKPVPNFPGLKRVQWSLPAQKPKVTLIIPTRDQYALLSRCLTSLLRHTDYPNVDIIVVNNDSQCERTLDYFDKLAQQGVKILHYPHPFNYAAINNLAVTAAKGNVLGLINNDIELAPDQSGWLTEMVSQLLRSGVGAVGAKLQWANGMVQHGGVVVGVNGLAAHVGNSWMSEDSGYLGNNQIVRQQSSVTAACLLTSKTVWNEVGGLNAADFAVNFNDVDYCLRLRRAGYRVLWTPFARLMHAESASRGLDIESSKAARSQREQQNLRLHWTNRLGADPSYHPGLSLDAGVGPYGGLMMPPNPGKVRFNTIF